MLHVAFHGPNATCLKLEWMSNVCLTLNLQIVENVVSGGQSAGMVSEGDVMIHVEDIAPLTILQNHGLTLMQVSPPI